MAWLRRAARVRTGDVVALAELGLLDAAGFVRAMRLAQRLPGPAGWRRRIDLLLLILASTLFAAGVICVVAYNWQAIGRWGKFVLAQALLALLVGAALWRGLGTLGGKLLLTVAIALIGPLLALFGQTYQTGADTFELFKGWALLAAPLVLASCFAPAWLLLLAIVEIGLLSWVLAMDLLWRLWFGFVPNWGLACLFNAAALVAWELAAHRYAWLSGRFGPRIIATVLLGLLTAISCMAIFGLGGSDIRWALVLWALTLVVGYGAYRVRAIELGMLSLGWLSATTVLMTLLLRLMWALKLEALGLWLCAAVLIAASAWGRQKLKAAAAEADARDDAALAATAPREAAR